MSSQQQLFKSEDFFEGLSKITFLKKNITQEKPFKENVKKLRLAWDKGNQINVQRFAGLILDNIKTCNVNKGIPKRLVELKSGTLKPPPQPTASKISLRDRKSAKPPDKELNEDQDEKPNDEPIKSSLSSIKQKANERGVEATKNKLFELEKEVNNLHEVVFGTKNKAALGSNTDLVIDELSKCISNIHKAVKIREKELKRKSHEEHIDDLKQIYKDVMQTDYKEDQKTEIKEKITSDISEKIERSGIEATKELYRKIKEKEFVMVAESKMGGKISGSKNGNKGENLTFGIIKELKEDINRLQKIKPKLETMFSEITKEDFTPKCDTKGGKRTPKKEDLNLNEDEMILDMTGQLREYFERKMIEFTTNLYKEIKGVEFSKSQTPARSKKDKKDMDEEDVVQEIKNKLKEDMIRLDEVKPKLVEMFNGITGDEYISRSESQQRKKGKDLDELEMLQDMTQQLKEYTEGITHDMVKKDDVRKELRKLNKAVSGDDFTEPCGTTKKDKKTPNPSDKNNFDLETMVNDISEGMKRKLSNLECMNAEIEKRIRNLHREVVGNKSTPHERNTDSAGINDILTDIEETYKSHTETSVDLEDVTEMLEKLYSEVFNQSADSTQRPGSRKGSKRFDIIFRNMSSKMKQCLENKIAEFTEDLYQYIKGREFAKSQTTAAQKKDKNGNTSVAVGEKTIIKIKNELKEDLTRLEKITSQLEWMFHNITGQKYVKQGKNTKDHDEMVMDMTDQLNVFLAKKLSCKVDSSEVENGAKRLYIAITGDENGSNASLSKSNVRAFFDDLRTECTEAFKLKKRKMDKQQQDLNLCQIKLEETEKDLQKALQDREEYLHRLSKIAGARLTHDNPDIADLSDQNRPTKIAEKYSELYDNGWTDAFDIIVRSNSETQTIGILLEVLKSAYFYCSETSRKQNVLLKTTLLKPTAVLSMIEERERSVVKDIKALEKDSKKVLENMNIEVLKLLVDMRKSSWKETLIDLSEDFQPEIVTEYWKDVNVKKYVHECLELTWLMALQSPPLVLDDSVTRKGKFDRTKYREYTQSGKTFDYLVWPALLIREGGSILQKGVAQGLK